jgi:uncharacterized membrane protein
MEFPGNLTQDQLGPTSDEKTMAALSHFFGWLVALIVYFTQREKSKFVRFQALQAIVFDAVVMIVTLVFISLVMLLFFAVMMVIFLTAGLAANSTSDPTGTTLFVVLITFLPMLPFLIFLPYSIAIMVFRVVAGVKTAQGQDYRHPVIGRLVEQWSRD